MTEKEKMCPTLGSCIRESGQSAVFPELRPETGLFVERAVRAEWEMRGEGCSRTIFRSGPARELSTAAACRASILANLEVGRHYVSHRQIEGKYFDYNEELSVKWCFGVSV